MTIVIIFDLSDLVTFNYSISHLQLTVKIAQIWLKFSEWNFNISIGQFWIFLVKNVYLSIVRKQLVE